MHDIMVTSTCFFCFFGEVMSDERVVCDDHHLLHSLPV